MVILSLTLPLFVQVAQAGVLDDPIISFSSCAGAGFISNLVKKGLDELKAWVIRKFGGFLEVPLPGLGSEVPVIDKSVKKEVENFKKNYAAKEGVHDIIARCAAREVLTAMGRNITNVARTGGRDGGPAWVRNWRNFQLDSQYRGEGIFRGMLASTKLCNYFESDLKQVFGANQRVNLSRIRTRANDFDSFQVRTGCTLPNNFDFNKYKQDFSGNGGWEAWSRLLEPQNNFYGVLFQSLDEANRQRAIEESANTNEAGPTGFTGTRGRSAAESCAVKSPTGGRCLIYKDILTPGGILSGAVIGGIETELQWVATTDELNELIATGINVLLNRLWNLSDPNEGNYIVPGSPEVSITPFPPPDPEPTENPAPTPLPGEEPASLLSDVQAERARYGTPLTPEEMGQIMNAVAWRNRDSGWGVSRKDFGEFCPSPAGPIACDILHHRPTNIIYDVLIASDIPAWQFVGYQTDPRRPWVAPAQP